MRKPLTRPGESFEDPDVAECYLHRAPYANNVYPRMVALCAKHDALLDLGCGPGKLARRLASDFDAVTAVDASRALMAVGRRLPNGMAKNIAWVEGLAEEVTYLGPYDLVAAGASIHWMDHAILFPRLIQHLADEHVFASIEGDGAYEPPWQDAWVDFLNKWIPKITGAERSTDTHDRFIRAYEAWVDIDGDESYISAPFSQSIEDFVACQHSRDTFTRKRLGAYCEAYDRELSALLAPHEVEGKIEFVVKTRLTYGRIKNPR